jgi:outer membrane receptor protein involved in Fe transport
MRMHGDLKRIANGIPFVSGISIASLLCSTAAIANDDAQESPPPEAREPTDIIVTATRRDTSLLQTPVSISAYSQEELDAKGVRNMADLARMTPGVSLNEGTFGINFLVIRGLTSTVGATMNGVYIDDTPVQVRNLSITSNFYPAMFDLERVEILRGPQGTLFGAGSMGGAVRFISAKPSVSEYSGFGRAEVAITEDGAPSYEIGAAVGGPIVEGKIGFRASGYYRRDGGWVDRVPYIERFGSGEQDGNGRDTFVGNFALTFEPTEDIAITPSIYYQRNDRNDTGFYLEWRPGVDLPAYPELTSGEALSSSGRDEVTLYSVKAEANLGAASIISNTSYLDRKAKNRDDGTGFFLDILGLPAAGFGLPEIIDERFFINVDITQRAFTQELRIQSNTVSSPLSYVAGIFYQNTEQSATEFNLAFDPDRFYLPSVNGNVAYGNDVARDEQLAFFGQLDYKITDKLSVSAGLRYSYLSFDYRASSGNNLPTDTMVTGGTSEYPVTPKFGVEYRPNDNLMLYASAGKGFRPGGINNVPAFADPACLAQLQNLGYDDFPRAYESDSTWSYELGAKGRIGRVVRFAADVFQIDWSNVQRTQTVLNCTNPFIDNLGSSRARGVEAQINVTPVAGLSLNANVSYTNATVQETLVRPAILNPDGTVANPAGNIVTKGDRFAPPWIVSLSADYETGLGSGDLAGYGRVQWDHRSGLDNPSGNLGFNPLLSRVFTRNFVTARLGVKTGGVDASLFVDNLLNSQDELSRLAIGAGQRLLRYSYRPRTFGVTTTYRF